MSNKIISKNQQNSERNKEKEIEKLQTEFNNIAWYYKKYFEWTYLNYNGTDDVVKRIIFKGGKNNLKEQVIVKLIKINNSQYEILKEPYFLSCLKNNRYFIEIVDLFPSKDCDYLNIILRDEGVDLNNFIIFYIYSKIDYNITIPNISRFIIFQVCCGLKILHQNGLSHNDIKLGNIIIFSTGQAKICDLGSADINNTVSGCGTLGYYSPQAMLGKIRNMEDDMYALGIVFLELLNRQIGIFLRGLPNDTRENQLIYILSNFYDISLSNGNWNENIDYTDIITNISEGSYEGITFRLKEKVFKSNEDEENKELIKDLLEINPKKRKTAEDVIKLPMFSRLKYEFESNNTNMKYNQEDYNKYFNTKEFNKDTFKSYVEFIREKLIGKTLIEEELK